MTGGGAVVVGAAGIDTNVYVADEVDLSTEGHFASVTDGLGQAGCYSASVFTGLGVPTALVGALGDDGLAEVVRRALSGRGVELVELRDPGGTHRSVNLVHGDGRRINFFDAKRASDVAVDRPAVETALAGARIVHVHLDDWCRQVLGWIRAAGATLAVDLQDVWDPADPYRADFVRAADLLFLSAAHLPEPERAARALLAAGPARLAVVGLGAGGCLVVERDGPATWQAPVEHPEPVVDTNGAGDALAVGFLHAHVLSGMDPLAAARHGQAAARIVCTRRGDEKRFPPAEEVTALAAGAVS